MAEALPRGGRGRLAVGACLATILLQFALPARAGLFDDDEARQRIEQLRQQTNTRLETTSRTQLDLINQIETLREELAKVRGQVEVLTYELEAAQKRQKDFYVDLDNRLRKLEAGAVAGAEGAAVAPAKPAVDPANETRDYEAALNQLKGGRYPEAAAAFLAFTRNYPGSAFVPSAHYWAATGYFQARDYKRAMENYAKVAAQWPDDAKAPEAMLGTSNCQQELGDAPGQRKTLEALLAKYPGSNAAQMAKQKLAKTKK